MIKKIQKPIQINIINDDSFKKQIETYPFM